MLNILARQGQTSNGNFIYLISQDCWENLQAQNFDIESFRDLVAVDMTNIHHFVQTIDAQQKQSFLKLVGQKVNFMQIDHFILSPKLKTATRWKTVSTKFYSQLQTKGYFSFTLPLAYINPAQQVQNDLITISQKAKFKPLRLLLCSYFQNHLFYGYVDQKVPLQDAIKQIIVHFEYFKNEDTKVTFLETNEFRNFKFQNCIFQGCKEGELIMVHGLRRHDNEVVQDKKQTEKAQRNQREYVPLFQSPRMTRMQRNGEEITMADQDTRTMSQHTMSTGAQTPFTYNFEDQDFDLCRPYQNYGLFGSKLYQQIEHMKQYAREAIYTDIIEVPMCKQQLMLISLQKIAEDMEQNIQKRRLYHKQLAKDGKQYYKEPKQSHHSIHTKDKDNSLRQTKQSSKRYEIERNQKSKQKLVSVVHFSLGCQNN